MCVTGQMFGQKYWEKTVKKDFYENEVVNLWYQDSNYNVYSWYDLMDGVLFIKCPCPDSKSFNIAWDAYVYNHGKTKEDGIMNVAVNFDGKIDNISTPVIYPEVSSSTHDYYTVVGFPMLLDNMLKGKYVKIRYYEDLWDGWVEEKVNLNGFANAYNSKGRVLDDD